MTLTLDGSFGEGGGQILRTALSLSVATGTPFRITRIRAGRSRPGLLHQHLTAVRAAAAIGGARVEGAELGSQELRFEPREVRPGEYTFEIGTAGSAGLVLQTVLPPLLTAAGPSRLELEGGTHNPSAPPFDFLARCFLPLLERMGPRLGAELLRPGFFPAGGGRMRIEIEPVVRLKPLELVERGPIVRRRARALVARLPRHIAERELREVRRELGWAESECEVEEISDSAGPGNTLVLEVTSEVGDSPLTEIITAFGRRGVPAERVAGEAVEELRRYLDPQVPVGLHLADQLLLPLALAGGGRFLTLPLSSHARTHVEVIRRFLPVAIRAVEEDEQRVRVEVKGEPRSPDETPPGRRRPPSSRPTDLQRESQGRVKLIRLLTHTEPTPKIEDGDREGEKDPCRTSSPSATTTTWPRRSKTWFGKRAFPGTRRYCGCCVKVQGSKRVSRTKT